MLMMQRTACITLRVPRYAGSVSPHPRVQLGCVRGPQQAEERTAVFICREHRGKACCLRRSPPGPLRVECSVFSYSPIFHLRYPISVLRPPTSVLMPLAVSLLPYAAPRTETPNVDSFAPLMSPCGWPSAIYPERPCAPVFPPFTSDSPRSLRLLCPYCSLGLFC